MSNRSTTGWHSNMNRSRQGFLSPHAQLLQLKSLLASSGTDSDRAPTTDTEAAPVKAITSIVLKSNSLEGSDLDSSEDAAQLNADGEIRGSEVEKTQRTIRLVTLDSNNVSKNEKKQTPKRAKPKRADETEVCETDQMSTTTGDLDDGQDVVQHLSIHEEKDPQSDTEDEEIFIEPLQEDDNTEDGTEEGEDSASDDTDSDSFITAEKLDDEYKTTGVDLGRITSLEDWTVQYQTSGGIIVEGHKIGDGSDEYWHSSQIVQRITSRIVQTGSGSMYKLVGRMDKDAMITNGGSEYLSMMFREGFPLDWQEVLEKYRDAEQSHSESEGNKKVEKAIKKKPKPKFTKPKSFTNINQSKEKASRKRMSAQNVLLRASGIFEAGTEADPLVVAQLPTTRSGRKIIPPLAHWTNQRIRVMNNVQGVDIDSGTRNDMLGESKLHFKTDPKLFVEEQKILESKIRKKKIDMRRRRAQKKHNLSAGDILLKKPLSSVVNEVQASQSLRVWQHSDDSADSRVASSTDEPQKTPAANLECTNEESAAEKAFGAEQKQSTHVSDCSVARKSIDSVRVEFCDVKVTPGTNLQLRNRKSPQVALKNVLGEKQNTPNHLLSRALRNMSRQKRHELVKDSGIIVSDSTDSEVPTMRRSQRANRRTTSNEENIVNNVTATITNNGANNITDNVQTDSVSSRKKRAEKKSSMITEEDSVSEYVNPVSKRKSVRNSGNVDNGKKEASDRDSDFEDSGSKTRQPRSRSRQNKKSSTQNRKSPRAPVKIIEHCADDESSEEEEEVPKIQKSRSKSQQYDKITAQRRKSPRAPVKQTENPTDDESSSEEEDVPKTQKSRSKFRQTNKSLAQKRKSPRASVKRIDDESDESTDEYEPKTLKLKSKPRQRNNSSAPSKKSPRAPVKSKYQEDSEGDEGVRKSLELELKKDLSDEEDVWSDAEIRRFKQAYMSIPLDSRSFWEQVAEIVGTKSTGECRDFHFKQGEDCVLVKKPRSKPRKTEKVTKPSQITGGKGTLKRKRQIRELIENRHEESDEDIFNSTPYRSAKRIKLPSIASPSVPVPSMDDFRTPGASDPKSRSKSRKSQLDCFQTPVQRPHVLKPVSEKRTPYVDMITSPGFCDTYDRDLVDGYVHKMKKKSKGRKWGIIHRTQQKSFRQELQKQNKFDDVESEAFQMKETDKHDEEDQDYYFSDNDD